MSKYKILYVEDEESLGQIVSESIESRGYDVRFFQTAAASLKSFCNDCPDICILDIMLPDKDGFDLANDIRNIDKQVPIVFLTAKSKIADIKKGFNLGAIDYIKKPFSIEELIIRLDAILRKEKGIVVKPEKTDTYNIGNYLFKFNHQTLKIGSKTINITSREAELLKLLIENKNSVLKREIVLNSIWGDDSFFNARSMDVFITKLRKHLSGDPNVEIINIRGVGYKIVI